jgi:hypothetical protein
MHAHLVLIETSANQAYIFASNKLRENAGASHLIDLVGRGFVPEAAAALSGVPTEHAAQLTLAADGLEVLQSAAGRALVAVVDRRHGRELVARVTERALLDCPGLECLGIVGEALDLDRLDVARIGRAVGTLLAAREELRGQVAGQPARFQRLPILAPCRTSGLPASALSRRDGQPISTVSLAKQQAADAGWSRIVRQMSREGRGEVRLERNLDRLERRFEALDRIGVIHIDGNGLGSIFMEFGRHLPPQPPSDPPWRHAFGWMRRFSLAVEACAVGALRDALETVAAARDLADRPLPVVPLVLGGDDVTLLCEASLALDLAAEYLLAFERQSAENESVVAVVRRGLTACAGVALVKPHYPFHAAYDLTESLLRSAKRVKAWPGGPYSALDFHLLNDTAYIGLDEARTPQAQGSRRLFGGPYIVGGRGPEPHRWERLQAAAQLLARPDDEGGLSSVAVHAVNEALDDGPQAVEAVRRMRGLGQDKLGGLAAPDGGLFWRAHDGGEATLFRDALQGADTLRRGAV